ncbi:hypothetical protein A3Q56_02643 [Intoshia linei]|uniref:Atos-like conserved domain-containing protein n=1 Tax=Intoshia linei TaxID=1819745 RepID=A0A177B5N8_9BILA|nr:hypothetical protein A3Q56_02643 [Intoshia linei]
MPVDSNNFQDKNIQVFDKIMKNSNVGHIGLESKCIDIDKVKRLKENIQKSKDLQKHQITNRLNSNDCEDESMEELADLSEFTKFVDVPGFITSMFDSSLNDEILRNLSYHISNLLNKCGSVFIDIHCLKKGVSNEKESCFNTAVYENFIPMCEFMNEKQEDTVLLERWKFSIGVTKNSNLAKRHNLMQEIQHMYSCSVIHDKEFSHWFQQNVSSVKFKLYSSKNGHYADDCQVKPPKVNNFQSSLKRIKQFWFVESLFGDDMLLDASMELIVNKKFIKYKHLPAFICVQPIILSCCEKASPPFYDENINIKITEIKNFMFTVLQIIDAYSHRDSKALNYKYGSSSQVTPNHDCYNLLPNLDCHDQNNFTSIVYKPCIYKKNKDSQTVIPPYSNLTPQIYRKNLNMLNSEGKKYSSMCNLSTTYVCQKHERKLESKTNSQKYNIEMELSGNLFKPHNLKNRYKDIKQLESRSDSPCGFDVCDKNANLLKEPIFQKKNTLKNVFLRSQITYINKHKKLNLMKHFSQYKLDKKENNKPINCLKTTFKSKTSYNELNENIDLASIPGKHFYINFEESILKRRFKEYGHLKNFYCELVAHGNFKTDLIKIPLDISFFKLNYMDAPSPYLGTAKIKRYMIPESGFVQITIFYPNDTMVKLFSVPYDFKELKRKNVSFIRHRIYFKRRKKRHVKHLLHMKVVKSSSGRLYINSEIKMVFSAYRDDYGDPRVLSNSMETFETTIIPI